MTNTPAPRKRRPVLTEQGRQLLQKQRGKLNREQALLGERLVRDALTVNRLAENNAKHFHPEFNAMSRSVVRRVAAVLASEQVTPAIKVAEGALKAFTDFETITVIFQASKDPRLTAAVLRGLLYHEGGHIRWTTPLPIIAKTMGVTPNAIPPMYHQAWNAMEDQRMETAVVSDSPRKAGYFVPVILTEMAQDPTMAAANWPLFIWRRYLPRHIRRAARQAFVALHDARDGMGGERLAQEFERVTTDYVVATTHEAMWNAIVEMEHLMRIHKTAFDCSDSGSGHNAMRRQRSKDAPLDIPIDPSMLEEDNESGEGEGTVLVPTKDEAPADAPKVAGQGGEGQADKADDDTDVDSDAGGSHDSDEGDEDEDKAGTGAGGGEGDHSATKDYSADDFSEALQEAIKDAEDERYSDPSLDGDVQAYEQAMDSGQSKLPAYVGGISGNVAASAAAESAAQAIEDAFNASVMDRMPAWVEQQRRGVLNVGRYMTRQAGEVDVFRQWADDDQPGYNMAVSILLDYSGSMGGDMGNLAQAAYAAKLACQRLNIPCTVTLWDESARTLWDGNEQASGLPILASAGGTQPDVALADLDNQRQDREQHLVLIMTDGYWQGEWEKPNKRSLGSLSDNGRTIIGFGYGVSAAALIAKGCRDAYSIRNLMDIPKALEQLLPDLA